MINLRGTILPVFDLGDKFDLCRIVNTRAFSCDYRHGNRRQNHVGVIVDEISDVVEITPEAEYQQPSPGHTSRKYLKGVGEKRR